MTSNKTDQPPALRPLRKMYMQINAGRAAKATVLRSTYMFVGWPREGSDVGFRGLQEGGWVWAAGVQSRRRHAPSPMHQVP